MAEVHVEDLVQSGRRTVTLGTVGLVLTGLVLFAVGAHTVQSYHVTKTALVEQLQLKELIGQIVHLDEVLTMSARMAAATGDTAWEQRYRRFEPELDKAIQEATRLTQKTYDPGDAAATDAANVKLVDMEHRSFELVHQGRAEEAKAVLFSAAYEEQKKIYAEGMVRLRVALEHEAQRILRTQRTQIWWSLLGVVVALIVLLGAWIQVFRTMRQWHQKMLADCQKLSQHAAVLVTLNSTLENKVRERTEELSQSNQELKTENASRKQAEEALANKVQELESLNRIMMNREERILELKQEVGSLRKELGRPGEYGG